MLHTLTYELDLPQNRTIQLKLPDTIKTGKHHIVLVIDEKEDQPDDLSQRSVRWIMLGIRLRKKLSFWRYDR